MGDRPPKSFRLEYLWAHQPMRIAFLILLWLHAAIHLMWFAHAFGWLHLSYFQKEIPGMVGFSWLIAAGFFIRSSVLILQRKAHWFQPALIGVLISQMWIFSSWEDTKYGSLANLLLLIGTLVGYAKRQFENQFREHVLTMFENDFPEKGVLQEEDLKALPALVQQYVRKSGALGKPHIRNFRVEFEGEMRQYGKPWFSFTSEQYNFIFFPTRLFFMKGRLKGLSVWGYHNYRPQKAKMDIRALSLLPQLRIEAEELYPTETVTYLNDLCLFAPGALVDKRIRWEEAGPNRVRATLELRDVVVSAELTFDASGDLVNFRSEDRYDISKMKRFPFETPVKDFREFEGIRLPAYGEAVWHYPEGPFVYGKFRVKSVQYNRTALADAHPGKTGVIGKKG